MEEEITNLNIVDEEEEPVQALGNEDVVEEDYSLCLVGRVLMDSMVHFPSMRNILVDLWQPLGGVSITEIGKKQVLFRFFNEFLKYDAALVMKGVNKFMCIKVRLDAQISLKRKKLEVVFGWDFSLRAPPRKATPIASRWLRDDSRDGIRIEMELDGGQEGRTFVDIQFVHPYQIRESGVGGHQDMSRNHTNTPERSNELINRGYTWTSSAKPIG
ncbi:hypothetical protein CXB51_033009 [Gossypium anomalum]|uniref:DUF4283 domain-containing protein n=1 Tax=Gossypium anomalum TaxID=47600 RepID=A0A8J5Y3L7_9ROSI|nr:hypothetical protein CXB51_033009 [Gossypium anomalum]